METSVSNRFIGIVDDIIIGAVNAEVHIRLKSDAVIVAAITKESVDILAIKIGMELVALIKSSQIILVTDFGGYQFSARNQLQGQIIDIKNESSFFEIDIELKGGERVTIDVSKQCNLNKNQTVSILFKASSVILAVKT